MTEIVSSRFDKNLYHGLIKFCAEEKISMSQVIKIAVRDWSKGKEVPQYLRDSVLISEADEELKIKLKRTLFLHNVKRKITRIVVVERIEFEFLPDVLTEYFEMFIKNARHKGWTKEADYLQKILNWNKDGDTADKMRFSKWVGVTRYDGVKVSED